MKISLMFDVVFSAAGIISLFLGIYILSINSKSKMNIMYFWATVALEFWSFGFSMAISENNLSDVLFWRRFSAIGWGAFFSILLHFFLLYPVDGEAADMLIKNADIAMYKAKEQGKNKYLFCTLNMKNEILMKMKLTNSLYRALERDEFILHYQPQVCTKTKKVIAAEALIRWDHPELGMIPPSVFIPLAEQTGLIGPIGEWVLRTACMQCKSWHLSGLPAIRIAVNVSVIQFRNPDFISQIRRILEETQLEPRYLELEITESVAIHESEYIIEVLNALKILGISLSIDDFGTEYSSLSRLTSMPIDRIKMDIQFIRSIHKSDKDKAIALGIIGLAHNLGLKVIAEGVETEMQMDFLNLKKYDEIQGFYFYCPVNTEDFEIILRK